MSGSFADAKAEYDRRKASETTWPNADSYDQAHEDHFSELCLATVEAVDALLAIPSSNLDEAITKVLVVMTEYDVGLFAPLPGALAELLAHLGRPVPTMEVAA